MRSRAAILRSQGGFTIVEVLAAMVILLIGLGGTLKVYDGVAGTAAQAKLREQGVALQRELVEAARSLKYADLRPGTLVPRLQAQPGLADVSSAPGWQLRRRGVTYTVAAGACTVDDVRDSTGPHDTATFCATGPGTTSQATCASLLGSSGAIQGTGGAAGVAVGDCGLDLNLDGQVDNLTGGASGTGTDDNADDYKRIVVLVRWTNGGGSRYVLQDSTVPSPGAADAIQITSLTGVPAAITGTGTTSITALATTDRPAATVSWSVDGTTASPAAMTGSGTSWNFTWALGSVTPYAAGSTPAADEVLDGTYIVSARAYDEYSRVGPERAETVVIDRRRPFAVPGQVLRNDGSAVEVTWTASRERDVQSYQVRRDAPSSAGVVLCTVTTAQTCRDTSPPSGPLNYYVVALDGAGAGDVPSPKLSTKLGTTPPDAPVGLAVSAVSGGTKVTWAAPASGASSYRVYRDGTALGDLRATPSGTTYTDTQTGGGSHNYWVSALNNQGVESVVAGPVTG